MTKSQAKKWVTALRSGKYKQTQGRLQDEKGYYCCLGVACEIFIPKEKQTLFPNGVLVGAMPLAQTNVPLWIIRLDHVSTLDVVGATFASMNDDEKMTFDEIADIIQIYWVENEN